MKDPRLIEKLRVKAQDSRKAAIRLFCLECVCFSEAEVTRCTGMNCPLFKWRKGRVLGEEVEEGDDLELEEASAA
jgi:hypothetical protein